MSNKRVQKQLNFLSEDQLNRFTALAAKLNIFRGDEPNVSGLAQELADGKIQLLRRRSSPVCVCLSVGFDHEQQYQSLVNIATMYGLDADQLIKAIANKEVHLVPPGDLFGWSQDRISAMLHAIWLSQDLGQYAVAHALVTMLTERTEVSSVVKEQLAYLQSKPWFSAYETIQGLILARRPFRVNYQHGDQDVEVLNVLSAQFYHPSGERHIYVAAGCLEQNTKETYPHLKFNHSLRLDRILSIEPVDAAWDDSCLAWIEVTFSLSGGWAKSYEHRPDDVADENISGPDGNLSRRITRRIFTPFWLEREILRYGEAAEILSPQFFRERIKTRLQNMVSRYGDLPT